MEEIQEKIDELCPLNQSCSEKDCPKIHPRFFTGICIYHLKNEKHDNNKCKKFFQPKNLKEVKQKLQSSINGVYLINLCPLAEECTNKKSCGFLHRDWIDEQKLCFAYLSDDCEKGKQCKRTHKSWRALQIETQEKYQYLNLDPERLCLVKQYCKCKNHHELLKGFCLENFVGQCAAKGKCSKIHVDWEDIKLVKKDQFENKKVKPCTIKKIDQIHREDTKFWEKLEMLFNKNVLLKIKENVKEKNVIDILFLMDCTGSMKAWIESAKNNILDIISSFQKSIQSTLIRVAFIGYRDFCDKEKKIEYYDFTSDIMSIKKFIGSLTANGGGDGAEDISGAIEFALKLNYSKHPDTILCTYLVCDAPTHGKQYHDIKSDDLMDKIPKDQLENIMRKFNNLKQNNYFFCCKISSLCDKMFKIMQQSFKDLEITECQNIGNFPDLVKFTLFSSYTKSQLKIQQPKLVQKIRIKANFVKHIPFKGIKKDTKGNTLNFMGNFLNQLGENQISGETVLEIDLEPFKSLNDAEGKSSIIFKVFDVRQNRNLVVKFLKSQFESAKLNKKNYTFIENAERSVNVRYLQTMIAKLLACEFRNDTKKNNKAPPIFYPTPIKYELLDYFYQVKKLYAETDINLNLKWEKISNNTLYLDQSKKAYATFSHYTYEMTNGQLLITDLQGKGQILSDPSIHTTLNELAEGLNDSTNIHQEGIEGFSIFQHKQCNELCKSLNLTRQIFTSDATDDECTVQNFNTNIKKKKEVIDSIANIQIQEVNCVCDLCGEIYVLEFKQYQENNQFYFHCEKCCQVNNQTDVCKCCGNLFTYNQNVTIRLGYQPTDCDKCKASCQMKIQKCFYCETGCQMRGIRSVTIGEAQKYICQEGQQFFESIYCSDCKEPFSYQQWPTLDEYSSQQYACYSCKKRKR